MAYVIGIAVFVLIIVAGRITGTEDRRFYYPLTVVVIALLYVLFAIIDGRPDVILKEGVGAAVFVGSAVLAYVRFPIFIAIALIAHGVFDWIHPLFISNSGVPTGYPEFCFAVDVPLGMYLIIRRYGFYAMKDPDEHSEEEG